MNSTPRRPGTPYASAVLPPRVSPRRPVPLTSAQKIALAGLAGCFLGFVYVLAVCVIFLPS